MFKLSAGAVFFAMSLGQLAMADLDPWDQCGGDGWTGDTVCTKGWACAVVNQWYYQCQPDLTPPTPPASANYWFSFGDSYTQTGFAPNSTLPDVGNPMGNPPYPGWTATGGPNWIDTLSTSLNNSLVLTYNYAYGGATIDASLVPPYTPEVLSLVDQIDGQFLAPGGAAGKPTSAPWTGDNALFSVWIGINDISGSYWQGGDRAAFSGVLFDREFGLVQEMYDKGARNFLFLNVPSVNRSPAFLITDPSNQQLAQSVIELHNKIYIDRVNQFASANSGVKTWIWDSYTEFNKILDDLAGNGFNPDPLAYGGETDFWGNDFHPSAAAHTLFAKSIRELLGDTKW